MCRHTQEPTVLSRLSCRPPHLNGDRFHQPCLFPQAHFQEVRTVVPVPRGGHLPLRAARIFLLCVSLEVFATPTRRHHGRMLIHPSLLRVPHRTKRCLHTRKFGTLASPPPPVSGLPWDPIPWPPEVIYRFTGIRK